MSCDHSHVPLHCQIIKRKRKGVLNQEKAKKNISAQAYHNTTQQVTLVTSNLQILENRSS